VTPSLRTSRLNIRPFALEDAAFIVRLLNEPSFIEHIADRGVRTIADAERYLMGGPLASYDAHGFGLCMVELRADGRLGDGRSGDGPTAVVEPVGMCGLLKRDSMPHPDLGYAFLPNHCGQGLAREAATAVVEHARVALRLPRVLAVVGPGNTRSIRLLEMLGFRREGPVQMPGCSQDSVLFASESPRADGRAQGAR
jgi:ribosomal-protein-alanine N-acetyltransferase